MKKFDYQNKTALITGASSGIGFEFARQLHGRGAKVVMLARRKSLLDAEVARLNTLRADSAEALVLDLASSEDLVQALSYLHQNQIDILINNAGHGSFGSFAELDLNREISQIRLNVEATVVLAHAAIKRMIPRRSGVLVSVSSVAAFQPLPFMSTYAATKAFNYVHTAGLRAELKGSGVRVLAVCPGPTATEFGGAARVPGTMTGVVRDSVVDVVKASLSALDRNRSFVVTGWRSKIAALVSVLLPVSISAELIAWQFRKVISKMPARPHN